MVYNYPFQGWGNFPMGGMAGQRGALATGVGRCEVCVIRGVQSRVSVIYKPTISFLSFSLYNLLTFNTTILSIAITITSTTAFYRQNKSSKTSAIMFGWGMLSLSPSSPPLSLGIAELRAYADLYDRRRRSERSPGGVRAGWRLHPAKSRVQVLS